MDKNIGLYERHKMNSNVNTSYNLNYLLKAFQNLLS